MKEFLAVDDIRDSGAWQAAIAEFVATFGFVFLGLGAVAFAAGNILIVALAHGLAITLFIIALGRVSGGHINPAVTVAAVVTQRMGLTKGLMYVVAQLGGAALGAFTLAAFLEGSGIELSTHNLASGLEPFKGIIVEAVLTFFLVFTVIAVAMDPRGSAKLAPFAIGFIVLVDHFVGVPLTGASMNPARSFGPALAAGEWANHWVYWVGPIIGSIVAAVFYELVFVRWNSKETA